MPENLEQIFTETKAKGLSKHW